jgi:hypothetical protein
MNEEQMKKGASESLGMREKRVPEFERVRERDSAVLVAWNPLRSRVRLRDSVMQHALLIMALVHSAPPFFKPIYVE